MTSRADVIAAARSWEGVAWRHQGRSREGGIDCVGLIIMVARDLGLSGYNDIPYGRRPNPQQFMDRLKVGGAIPSSLPQMKAGDMVILRDYAPVHCGIIGYLDGDETVIHSHQPRKRVIEDGLDATPLGVPSWRTRIVSVFQFPGLED